MNSKSQSSSTNQSKRRKLDDVGTDAFFEPSPNTAKKVEAEDLVTEVGNSDAPEETAATETVTSPSKSKSTAQEETKVEEPQTETKKSTTSTSSKKKSAKSKTEPKKEMTEKEELVKTTVYIEEDNFLALEDIQLKLKRKEKRRVTKNELFNTAIELLIKHYSD